LLRWQFRLPLGLERFRTAKAGLRVTRWLPHAGHPLLRMQKRVTGKLAGAWPTWGGAL
jgi:hypothetical protein